MEAEDIINLAGYSKISKQTGNVVLVLIDKDRAACAEVRLENLEKKGLFCYFVIKSLIGLCKSKIGGK